MSNMTSTPEDLALDRFLRLVAQFPAERKEAYLNKAADELESALNMEARLSLTDGEAWNNTLQSPESLAFLAQASKENREDREAGHCGSLKELKAELGF